MTWILFTCFAAFCQAGRNALQSELSKHLTVPAVTLARFLWAGPLAFVYLLSLYAVAPADAPLLSNNTISYVVGAAIMQIVATALMVVLFKQENFAIGAGLAKCEAPVAAFLGVLFFGTQLTLFGWIGVLIGAIAILMLSSPKKMTELSLKTVLLGLACSSAFALTSLWVREATLAISLPFPHRAAWVLFLVISLQTIMLIGFMLITNPSSFKAMFAHKKRVAFTSIASFLGSLGWFSAMSLQTVPLVKTLGQIEIFFMMLISIFILKEIPPKKDILALVLVATAAIFVMI